MSNFPEYQITQARKIVSNPSAAVHPFMAADAWALLKEAQGNPVNFRSPAFDGRFSADWLPMQLETTQAARARALRPFEGDPDQSARITEKVRSIATAKGYALRPIDGGASA